MIKSGQTNPSILLGADMLTFIVAFFFSIYFFSDNNYEFIDWYWFLSILLLWPLITYWSKLHSLNINKSFSLGVTHYLKAYIVLVGVLIAFYSIIPESITNSRIILASVAAFPLLAIPVHFLLLAFTATIKNKAANTKYILVAGIGNLAKRVEKNVCSYKNSEYKIKGFINCNKEVCAVGNDNILALKDVNQYLRDNPIDEIVIALSYNRSKKIKNIVSAADYFGIRVKYIPDYEGLFGNKCKSIRYGQFDAVNVRQLPLDETFSFVLKNAFDKLFSLVVLVLLLPVFLLLAILISLDSPGPVFYCPVRVGKGGKPFRVFKFRSMSINDTSTGGVMSTIANDPRITRLGRILRKYNLDELPQFFNVLLGDMSVVGPRPHRSYLNQQLQESVDKYMVRHYFKPGITGWAQVNGWRGPTDTNEQKCQRTIHDLWYMENWTLMLDVKIIFMTVYKKKAYLNAF